MEMREWLVVALTLVIGFILVVSVSAQITVEQDIPAYIQGAEELRQSEDFFSGNTIKVKGEFPNPDSVIVELQGAQIGTRRLEVKRALSGSLKVEIPFDIPTADYTLLVASDGKIHEASIHVVGFTDEELRSFQDEQGRGGGGGEQLNPAILYHSQIHCIECYWEHVLAGHPTDPNLLVLASGSGPRWSPDFFVSHDGARTWEEVDTGGVNLHSDSNVVITPEGKLFLTSLTEIQQDGEKWFTGILFSGPVLGNTFQPTFIRTASGLQPSMDFMKITYDVHSQTLFISNFGTFVSNFGYGTIVLKSTDNGRSFSYVDVERMMGWKLPQFIQSMDTTPTGELRAALHMSTEGKPDKITILRFDKDLTSDTISQGFAFEAPIRGAVQIFERGSHRKWYIDTGPKIAIDKSSRHNGRIYLTWAMPQSVVYNPSQCYIRGGCAVNLDIFLSYSDDDGDTWVQPVKVNDDTVNADQGFPSLRVDSRGVAHMAFLDRREAPAFPQYDIYYAKIVDNKVSKNIRINQEHIPNPGIDREPGDYLEQVVAYPSKVYVSYPCNNRPVGAQLFRPLEACVAAINPNLVPFPGEFIRGDANEDFTVDLSDAVFILSFLYRDGNRPQCLDAVDSNDDGQVDISDAIKLLNVLFQGGELAAPSQQFGTDPTDDQLDCYSALPTAR